MFGKKKNNLIPLISDKFRRNDNHLVYLFTNARDEPNIAEWIAHHILLGFDKVIVFDHLSKEHINTKIKTNFDNKLEVKRVDGSGNIKIKLMMDAVNIACSRNVSWMLYLDADEFLLLNSGITNIKKLLAYFSNADSVAINWLFFGSSGHITQPKGLITENFIKSDMILDKHVKTFVRPYIVKSVSNPHYYLITNPLRCYAVTGSRVTMGPFNNQPLPFIKTPAYIAHYYIQSEEEHLRRKGRTMDDGNPKKDSGLAAQVHTIYNKVVNNQLQNKYSNNIKEFLKKYDIVL